MARRKGPDSLSPIKSGESHDLVCLHGVDLFQMMELGDEGYTGNFDRPSNEKDSHSLGNGSVAYWPGPATRTGPAPLPPAPGPFLHWAPVPRHCPILAAEIGPRPPPARACWVLSALWLLSPSSPVNRHPTLATLCSMQLQAHAAGILILVMIGALPWGSFKSQLETVPGRYQALMQIQTRRRRFPRHALS
jgi:hypothetical protein